MGDNVTTGYVGLGEMGGALALRLQKATDLHVFDLNADAVQELVVAGATACQNLGEVGATCDLVFLCLPTSEHVRRVLFDHGGLATAMRRGSVIIDQTTGDPAATRDLAMRLQARGISLVDAPVSGGAAGATAGTIAIMVGASGEDFRRVVPFLEAISPNIFHVGGVGAGHVMKLVNNMVSGTQRLLTIEGLTLAAKNGVEPERAREVLAAGGARNAFVELSAKSLLAGDLGASFTLALMLKDMRLAAKLGADSHVPVAYAALTRDLYQLSIDERGADDMVNAAALVMEERARTRIVGANANAKEPR